jgi:hypothetical protein
LGNSSTTDNDLAHIDPETLLARFMHEEPLDIGRIEEIMCMYFILFYLFLVFLALATSGVGVLGRFWVDSIVLPCIDGNSYGMQSYN